MKLAAYLFRPFRPRDGVLSIDDLHVSADQLIRRILRIEISNEPVENVSLPSRAFFNNNHLKI